MDELERLWGTLVIPTCQELFNKYYSDDGSRPQGVRDRPATDPNLAYLLSGVLQMSCVTVYVCIHNSFASCWNVYVKSRCKTTLLIKPLYTDYYFTCIYFTNL
jgi:hypothetical protein